jgi:hypothetical protein
VEGSCLEGRLLEQSTKSKVLVKSLQAERKALQMRVQRTKASRPAEIYVNLEREDRTHVFDGVSQTDLATVRGGML